MRFLKSAPSKTLIYQISSKSDKLSISVIFGGPTPKKHKFSGKKSSDLNFDIIFGITTFERHYIPSYSKIRCDLDVA